MHIYMFAQPPMKYYDGVVASTLTIRTVEKWGFFFYSACDYQMLWVAYRATRHKWSNCAKERVVLRECIVVPRHIHIANKIPVWLILFIWDTAYVYLYPSIAVCLASRARSWSKHRVYKRIEVTRPVHQFRSSLHPVCNKPTPKPTWSLNSSYCALRWQ